MPNATLMDIAIANGSDQLTGLIEDVIKAHPELDMGAARTIKGIQYKTLVRTALPVTGFRAANKGTQTQKSRWENRMFEAMILNPQWEADCAVADRHEDGAEAFIALEASGQMESSIQTVCQQFYYGAGTNGDSLGFPGLIQSVDTTNMVVDAGGTTDNIASSCWAVRFGPKSVQWLWGNNGNLGLSELMKVRVTDSDGNPYTAYRQEILAYPGLQFGEVFAAGRIKKLTTDSGKGLTDALLSQLLEKFPAGRPPDAFFVSRRSLGQLQRSRTATNATGTPAPRPTDYEGIPILPTDAILNTETLAL
jgi:hypothetical protein